MIFIRADGAAPIDVDAFLSGAEDDLGSFGLGNYCHIETRAHTWAMNWKLLLDTFTESYHVRTLHRTTLAPTFDSNCQIYDPFGRHALSIRLRADVLNEVAKPREQWSLLPYATMQYFLLPNALVVHQLDHVEVWRLEPIDHARAITSIYAPPKLHSEKSRNCFVRNLDLLLHVTGGEDFPLMEQIQRNLESGAVAELNYGRNEAALIHMHRAVNELLAAAL